MSTQTNKTVSSKAKKVTTHVLLEMKEKGEKIAMLTAYDYSMARLIDQAGIDVILVGDSASNVMAGHETTLPITLDQMIYHAASVIRGITSSLVVVDLPFGTYQGNSKEALNSSIRIMKESGAHAVKMEGGSEIIESVLRIFSAGIPVMGHLGLMPQSIYKYGTYVVRAKETEEADTWTDEEAEKYVVARMEEMNGWRTFYGASQEDIDYWEAHKDLYFADKTAAEEKLKKIHAKNGWRTDSRSPEEIEQYIFRRIWHLTNYYMHQGFRLVMK